MAAFDNLIGQLLNIVEKLESVHAAEVESWRRRVELSSSLNPVLPRTPSKTSLRDLARELSSPLKPLTLPTSPHPPTGTPPLSHHDLSGGSLSPARSLVRSPLPCTPSPPSADADLQSEGMDSDRGADASVQPQQEASNSSAELARQMSMSGLGASPILRSYLEPQISEKTQFSSEVDMDVLSPSKRIFSLRPDPRLTQVAETDRFPGGLASPKRRRSITSRMSSEPRSVLGSSFGTGECDFMEEEPKGEDFEAQSSGGEETVHSRKITLPPEEPTNIARHFSDADSVGVLRSRSGGRRSHRHQGHDLFSTSVLDHWKNVLQDDSDESQLPKPNQTGWRSITSSLAYQRIVTLLIVLHAAYTGWHVHMMAIYHDDSTEDILMGTFFCIAFLGELALRIATDKVHFLFSKAWRWNMFDLIVILAMLIEQTIRYVESETKWFPLGVTVLRTLRLANIVRSLHIVRFLSSFREFRLLVSLLQCSFAAMGWVLVLLMVMVYIAGVGITAGTFEHCHIDDTTPSRLCKHFGTLDRTLISLYKAIFGGILWGDLMDDLASLNIIYPAVFALFIAVVLIGLVNTLTAVVLETKSENAWRPEAKLKEREEIMEKLEDVFRKMDYNKSGDISFKDFAEAMRDPSLVGLLSTLKLDVFDAKSLFALLDRDGTGVVQRAEFVLGCLQLKGEARALEVARLHADVATCSHEITEIRRFLRPSVRDVDRVSTAVPDPDRQPSGSGHFGGPGRTGAIGGMMMPTASTTRVTRRNSSRIPKTEERALSLKELQTLRRLIVRRCEAEGWADLDTGVGLTPEAVNLYHLVHHYILPLTAVNGVTLSGLDTDQLNEGDSIVQWDTSKPAALPIAVATVVEIIDGEDETLVVMEKGRFRVMDSTATFKVTCGDQTVGSISAVGTPLAISYKEAVSARPTPPDWFCCHWWGEPVFDFIQICEKHNRLRATKPQQDSRYWVCAYANCQHNLDADITMDPENSSFRKAMRLAQGVLLVLDEAATPFRRIWCDFELYKTISVDRKLLDIMTVYKKEPRLISQDRLPHETQHYKSLREQQFPINILIQGMKMCLEDGEASVELDKQRILECMAEDETGPGDPEERLKASLLRANSALHAHFALAAWSLAVNNKTVQDFDPDNPRTLCLPQILSADEQRQRVELSLAHSEHITDSDVQHLAQGLPPNLTELRLSFSSCPYITDTALHTLGDCLPSGLRALRLDFSNCVEITDTGVQMLTRYLPSTLRHVELHFSHCSDVGHAAMKSLADNLPPDIETLTLTLIGTRVNATFGSVSAVKKYVRANGFDKAFQAVGKVVMSLNSIMGTASSTSPVGPIRTSSSVGR